jgi:hypothetical protein
MALGRLPPTSLNTTHPITIESKRILPESGTTGHVVGRQSVHWSDFESHCVDGRHIPSYHSRLTSDFAVATGD